MGDEIDLSHRCFVNVAKKLNALFGHRHDARRKFDHLLENQLLFPRGIAQDRMQSCDHGHSEISQQCQQMAAARAPKDSEFVLQAEHIDVNQIQKIGRPPVRGDVLFRNFETHFGRIVISLGAIGHRNNRTLQSRILRGDRLPQVRCERGDSALPRNIIRQKCDLLNVAWQIHKGLSYAVNRLAGL